MTQQLRTADLGKPIEYRSDIDDFLAKVMIFINQFMTENEVGVLKETFLVALRNIYLILGEDAFRFSGISKRRPINMPLFECLYIYLCLNGIWIIKRIRLAIEALKESLDESGYFQEMLILLLAWDIDIHV